MRNWLKNIFFPVPGAAAVAAPSPADGAGREAKRRGDALLAEGRLDEAAHCYRQALAADSTDAAAQLNLGFILSEQGRDGEAEPALRQALAIRPGDPGNA